MLTRSPRSGRRAPGKRQQWLGRSLALVSVLMMSACGAGTETLNTIPPTTTVDLPQGSEPVELNPADFTTEIDHPYLPMEPGTRLTYHEVARTAR